ncbi:MAG: glutaminase A [Rikenellaceae bacterium]|nr:glutaminase A [Rikenellaceae bacterium]
MKFSREQITDAVKEAYSKCVNIQEGANADYIPYLKNIPSDLFGIAVSLPDGTVVEEGDTGYIFGIVSVSKVPTAILVMNQYGPDILMDKIGADATGLPFNSIFAILLEKDHPSTPLVNSGAISACSMVQPVGDSNKKWSVIHDFIQKMCGSELGVIEELYRSESETNFNNRSIAWLLKNFNRIYDDPDLSLDLYTRQCSLGVTARQLAVCAGTLANNGTNPVTGDRLYPQEYTSKIVSLIATVGFYEHTGNWMYTAGIPAKTGVGGGIMAVMPGDFGIAAFSPKLDESGNSVKAQAAIKYIVEKLGVNVYGCR